MYFAFEIKILKHSVLVFFQGETLATSPAQKFEEVKASVEDFVVLKHHLVKCVNWKVTIGVGIFECCHGGVKCVCLMAKRRVLHGDDL